MTYRRIPLSLLVTAAAAMLTASVQAEAPAPVHLIASADSAAPAKPPTLDENAAAKGVTPMAAATAPNTRSPPPCWAAPELTRLPQPLPRTAHLLASGQPIKIVAIGSSSTAGAGASSPAASYPSRLAVELAEKFPDQQFMVVNRGVNGEETADMLARFEGSVVAEAPDLILWQLGTNAVLRDRALSPASSLIQEGIARLKATGADVILIDLQFAPRVIAKQDAEGMVNVIAAAAKRNNVNLFRRFAMMRYWRELKGLTFETFVSPDELHLNDWSYSCVAKVLSAAIAEAATRPMAAASTAPTQSAAIAR